MIDPPLCRKCKRREVYEDDWQQYAECSNCLDAMAEREQEQREFDHFHPAEDAE